MQLTVNGDTRQITTGSSVQTLLDELGLGAGRLAVELNGEIVPRSEFSRRQLEDGDKLEIVQAIGGG